MKKNNLHNKKEGFKVPKNYFDTIEARLFDKISKENLDTPLLSDKLSSGLKTPDDYFDTFENGLLQKLHSEQDESSILNDNVKSGLIAPEGYFEDLEETILQKTTLVKKDTKVIPLFSRKNLLYVSGIAAMIAVIISISTYNQKESYSFDSVAISDIQSYFEEGNAELSDAEIAELLSDELSLTDTFYEDEISEEELENYLSNEELADEIIYIE